MVSDKINRRLLTGDRPTGPLHLGHYFGSLKNRVKLQDEGYETFIIIADYQVITDRLDTSAIKENITNLMLDYLSVGLNSKKTTFFVQSMIPQLSELTQIFSMLVSTSRVGRNPTVKEEIKAMKLESNVSLGMFSYPVSQAADILLFLPGVVPVGEDQLPHIELTKEIARKFNTAYSEVFSIPEALLSATPRLMGLDGSQKMSKSRNNAIFLSDSTDEVRSKIKKAVTDSGSEIVYDKNNKPNVANLIDLYQLIAGKKVEEIVGLYAGKGYKEFKEGLGEEIVSFLKPIQEKRSKVTEKYALEVLRQGNKKALEVAQSTLRKVKVAMKMDYRL